jgi:hypothetical protein
MLLANALHLAGTTSAVPQISIFMAGNADGRPQPKSSRAWQVRRRKAGQVPAARRNPGSHEEQPGLGEVIEALPANPFPDALSSPPRMTARKRWKNLRPSSASGPRSNMCNWIRPGYVASTPCSSSAARRSILLGALLGAGLDRDQLQHHPHADTHPPRRDRGQPVARRHGRIHPATLPLLRRAARTRRGYRGLAAGGRGDLLAARPFGRLARLYDLSLVLQTLDARDSACCWDLPAASAGWVP